jgi:2-oxoglutarate ferredoxin oxidoreductase subunit alpha
MQALYGRNGESPVAVLAASTPSDCFYYAFEAAKIAVEHMMPVILLTDGYLANGSEPFRIPRMSELPVITPRLADPGQENYKPYARDEEKLARWWAIPGTPGLEHRIGGLEKMAVTGTVSYVPENHEVMSHIRENKVERVQNHIPKLKVEGDESGDVLVVGWGGTYGHLVSTVDELRKEGKKVSLAHFNYIRPLPSNVEEVFGRFKKIVVCEINLGQFVSYLRMKHQQFDYLQINKIQGLPFTVVELKEKINKILEG